MQGIIVDAIKFRIREQNLVRKMQREQFVAALCTDAANLVSQYMEDECRMIDEGVANRCLNKSSVTYLGHTISAMPITTPSELIEFTYLRECKIPTGWSWDYRFEWDDYIEFILTGYNKIIFPMIVKMIKYVDDGDFEKYEPCCANGHCQTLSVRLLENLRSEILNAPRK